MDKDKIDKFEKELEKLSKQVEQPIAEALTAAREDDNRVYKEKYYILDGSEQPFVKRYNVRCDGALNAERAASAIIEYKNTAGDTEPSVRLTQYTVRNLVREVALKQHSLLTVLYSLVKADDVEAFKQAVEPLTHYADGGIDFDLSELCQMKFHGETLLEIICRAGHHEILYFLYTHRLDITEQNVEKMIAAALEKDCFAILTIIIKNELLFDRSHALKIFLHAMKKNQDEVTDLLIDHGYI